MWERQVWAYFLQAALAVQHLHHNRILHRWVASGRAGRQAGGRAGRRAGGQAGRQAGRQRGDTAVDGEPEKSVALRHQQISWPCNNMHEPPLLPWPILLVR